jgi:acetyl esterase/lipase
MPFYQPLIRSQPGKAIFALFAIVFNAARLPLWILYYIPSSLRQHPQWTYKQALSVRIARAFLQNIWLMEIAPSGTLSPGKEADKFVVVKPASPSRYVGIVKKDPEIQEGELGGTWYPKKLEKYEGGDVVLHFHGGGYTIGDGRTNDVGFLTKTIFNNTPATSIFCPQYRLASKPGGRFPAALQDAITTYQYLTETVGVPANKVTISGDSAGANLCLALLRYIADQPEAGLESPGCAWLWSLWVDPSGSLIPGSFEDAINGPTDYLTGGFGAWGARTLTPSLKSGVNLADPHINFKSPAFATPTPLWFSIGECEALFHDVVPVSEAFTAIEGNKVSLHFDRYAPHDVILVGHVVGFEKEAVEGAKAAGKFLQGL